MSTPAFRILGLQQIAIGALDKGELRRLWIDIFGLKEKGTFRSERENVNEDILELGVGPFAVEVDLMEPIDPDKRPRVDQPALNHIDLWVDNIEAAVESLSARGVRFAPGGIRKGAAGFNVCFIHPKGNEDKPIGGAGVLIELVEAPRELVEAFDKMATAQ